MHDGSISNYLKIDPNFEQIGNRSKRAFDKNKNLERLIFRNNQDQPYQDPRYVAALKENCYENKKAIDKCINCSNNDKIQGKTKWMPLVKSKETSICK